MAYCEWHEQIRNHYKTDLLMVELNVPRREAVGIIGMLSAWAIGHRPGGVIARDLIHVAVGWDKDPEDLVKALIKCGWLDEFDKKQVAIHDWETVTTGYRRARKDAKRKAAERAEAARQQEEIDRRTSKERPKPVRGQKKAKTVRGQRADRRAEQTEQTDRTDRPTKSEVPRSSLQQQPQSTPSSGPSGGTTGDEQGVVVAVPDRKEGETDHVQILQPGELLRERLLKQASIRLGTPILEAIGVDSGVATDLARAYPTVRILHVAEHAKKQDNPGGFARKALEQGWTVPDSNGAGLAKLLAALEAEAVAHDQSWQRMAGGGLLKKDPEFARRDGESEDDHFKRVRDLIQKRKSEGQK